MSSSPYSSRGLRKSPIDDRDSSVRNALINRAATQKPSITRDNINSIRKDNATNERQVRRDAIEQRGIAARNEARNRAADIRSGLINNPTSPADGRLYRLSDTSSRDDMNSIRERNASNERQIRRDAIEQRDIATRNEADRLNRMKEKFAASGAIQKPSMTRDDMNSIRERGIATRNEVRRDAIGQRGIAARNEVRNQAANLRSELTNNSASPTDRLNRMREKFAASGAIQRPSTNRDNMNSIRERGIATRNEVRRDAIGQRGIAARNKVREEAMAIKAKTKAEQFKNSQSNM